MSPVDTRNELLSFLNQPLESVVGLSKAQLNKITGNLGPKVFDLIVDNIPDKYETRLLALNIADLVPGEMSTFKGTVIRSKKGFGKVPAVISVEFDGHIINLTFFGKVGDIYITVFSPGDEVLV